MSLYNTLRISSYLDCDVTIILKNGEGYAGILTDGLVNECWAEDGEKESLAIRRRGETNLFVIALEDIQYISKAVDIVDYVKAS